LKSQNQQLAEENNRLRMVLYGTENKKDSVYFDSIQFASLYKFTPANIIKNSYSSTNNLLTLNKGAKDSIKQDFGVISSKGIIGIIDRTSNGYGTVISVLNTTSQISAQLKKTNHFGTLTWNSESPELVQLIDIPKIAPVQAGDTIVTSGRSSIFPKNVLIGVIEDFKLDQAENFYEINVRLFNDMTNLEHVYVIQNIDKPEITKLRDE
jgi:rod shape-determining protein MreC